MNMLSRLGFFLIISSLIIACGGGGNKTNSTDTDTDGDGLTDAEEAGFGTSTSLRDTDGDGYDDFEEVINRGFNPANNNFRFNPLIADLPKMRVEITSVPNISLNVTTNSGTSETREVTRSTESASTVSTSDTSSNSSSIEETHSVGVELGYSAGLFGGVSGSVSYDYSHATTNETAFSHTLEQIDENRTLLSNTEAQEQSEGTVIDGGLLAVNVSIRNDGNVSFLIKSLVFGAS